MLSLVAVMAMALTAAAQPAGGRGQRGDRGGDGQRGGRQRFDPAQMRARMMQRLQERLEIGDEDWGAIEPLVADVFEKQRAMRGNRGGFMGRGRGDREQEAAKDKTAADRLRETLEKDNASAEEIKKALADFRQEKTKNEADLKAAQEKLRGVLTVKQEASLVLMGILD